MLLHFVRNVLFVRNVRNILSEMFCCAMYFNLYSSIVLAAEGLPGFLHLFQSQIQALFKNFQAFSAPYNW